MIKRLLRTLHIMGAALREQMQSERAYLGDFWIRVLSPLGFSIAYLIFIDLLFRRVGAVGDYSKNDFLFLMLIGQFAFYATYRLLHQPLENLVNSVRTGNFDFLLLRPVPTRLFWYSSSIKPLFAIFTSLPNLIIIGVLIDWQALSITPISLLLGMLLFVCGFIICNTLLFILTLPVFKTGEAGDVLNIFHNLAAMKELPYNKLPLVMKIFSLTLLPLLISGAGATNVILQKSDPWVIIVPAIIATIFSVFINNALWRYALRNYTSASS